MARRTLPAGAGDERARNHRDQGPLNAQTTPVPAPPSPHGLSNHAVVQTSTPAWPLGQWRLRGEPSVKSIPVSKATSRTWPDTGTYGAVRGHISKLCKEFSSK